MATNAVMETKHEPVSPVQRALGPFERLAEFLKETRLEMSKVTTPTRSEVQSTTIVVIVAVFLFAGYFELVDLLIGNSLDKFFMHLAK
jgi:preprotein translocase subunit SecE